MSVITHWTLLLQFLTLGRSCQKLNSGMTLSSLTYSWNRAHYSIKSYSRFPRIFYLWPTIWEQEVPRYKNQTVLLAFHIPLTFPYRTLTFVYALTSVLFFVRTCFLYSFSHAHAHTHSSTSLQNSISNSFICGSFPLQSHFLS